MSDNKKYTKCNKVKKLSDFNKDKYSKDGFTYQCKVCSREKQREWQKNNKEKIKSKNAIWREKNKEHLAEYNKWWHNNNPEYGKIWYKNNKEHHKNLTKKWREANKEYLRLKEKEKLSSDINFMLAYRLRKRLYQAIKGNYKAGSAVRDLGCSIDELIIYLEKQFQSGMSWENYGKWHIDHIVPLVSFDLSDRDQLSRACHYTNLQPLWAKDNLSKGSNIA